MNVFTTTPATIHIRRGRLLGLIVGVAALAAAITWAVSALAFDTGGGSHQTRIKPTASTVSSISSRDQHIVKGINSLAQVQQDAAVKQFVQGIAAIAKAQQEAAVSAK